MRRPTAPPQPRRSKGQFRRVALPAALARASVARARTAFASADARDVSGDATDATPNVPRPTWKQQLGR